MTKLIGGVTKTKETNLDDLVRQILSDMKGLFNVHGEVEPIILDWMWVKSKYGSSPVFIEKMAKEEMSSKYGVKSQSISDALTNLVKKGVIVRQNRMLYSLSSTFPKLVKLPNSSKFTIEVTYNL